MTIYMTCGRSLDRGQSLRQAGKVVLVDWVDKKHASRFKGEAKRGQREAYGNPAD